MAIDDISLNSVDALVFDLGGVILEIDFDRVFARWADYSNRSLESIKAKFSTDCFYHRHERGEISSLEYFDSLRESLGIDLTDTQFIAGWNDIFVREVPGVAALLRRAKEKFPLYALSNTNCTHQREWLKKFANVMSLFNAIFASAELGKRKPEPEAFQMVSAAIEVPLRRILFFDDTLENIKIARALGMRTVHVKSLADIESSFQKILTRTSRNQTRKKKFRP